MVKPPSLRLAVLPDKRKECCCTPATCTCRKPAWRGVEPGAKTYGLEWVLALVRQGVKRVTFLGLPYSVKCAKSLRLRVFAEKGTVCVQCGREGKFFALEHHSNVTPHFNLYTDDGVLMTMDHIRPRSKGGAHDLTNLQPMCEPCNSQKSDHWVEAPK